MQNQVAPEALKIVTDIQVNISEIQKVLGNSPDLVVREWGSDEQQAVQGAIIYVSGLTDGTFITQFIVEPLLALNWDKQEMRQTSIDDCKRLLLPVGAFHETRIFDTLVSGLLSGETAVLCKGNDLALLIPSKGGKDRGVEEPNSQTVIRGPKEGFTENIDTNIALVRRKIKDPNLWVENFVVGLVTKTKVSIMYMNGIAKEEAVKEVRDRIVSIQIDSILESGYIEEWIQDKTFTVFPTIYNTERPDVIAAGILEGRIAILVDGTPFVLLVPAIFVQFFQAAEDYYQRSDISTLLRLLRFIASGIALLAPSLYIAITTFHQDMLPPDLLISLSAQREKIPFPAFVEALLMEMTFELLREAGIRLPKTVGQAISIVGALVIGQAAVEAGLVSAAMVIVVSITAISSFIIPAYNMSIAIRILRFGMMGLAANFGLFGIIAGIIGIIQHLCQLRSFGVHYMSPLAPVIMEDQKDTGIRVPWWGMKSRPRAINGPNHIRNDNPHTPEPNTDREG